MFQQRLLNPYQNMPTLTNNPHFRIFTAEELQLDMQKCFKLYDVTLYLAGRVEELYRDYVLMKQLKQPDQFGIKYIKEQNRQRKLQKFDRNLKVIQKTILEFKSQFQQFKLIARIIKKNLSLRNLLIGSELIESNEESKGYLPKPSNQKKGRLHLGNSQFSELRDLDFDNISRIGGPVSSFNKAQPPNTIRIFSP